jgi:hypothetical protein
MHQLKGVTHGPFLDAAVLGEHLAQTVAGSAAQP